MMRVAFLSNRLTLPAAVALAVAAFAPAAPALADAHSDAQARALDEAAQHEVKDHDSQGQAMFEELAKLARSGHVVTLADAPAAWRDGVRNGRRDTQEGEDRVRLRRIEARLAELSPSVRAANAALVAHAEVDTFRVRRELSEPKPWHTCAYEALKCAEADLAKLVMDGDRDGDGIMDSVDRCPDTPEDKDGFQDEDGCPDNDNDGDGIPDAADKCPNDAEDKDGFQDQDGCPDPDNDNDGIPDVKDKCPNTPETKNGIDDEDGCPDDFQRVLFGSNSTKLDAGAIDAMLYNAQILKSAPSLHLRLAGHCDAQNSEAYNYRLGQRRAEAVKNYMVQYLGIEPARIETESHGESEPVGDNATPDGRAQNRRVEFIVTGGF